MDPHIQTEHVNMGHIKHCARCGIRYDWRRSPSALKMTYCGGMCEKGDLGFSMIALERGEVIHHSQNTPINEVIVQ